MNDFKRMTAQQISFISFTVEEYSEVLTEWELDFFQTLLKFKKMSSKQKEIVKKIYDGFNWYKAPSGKES